MISRARPCTEVTSRFKAAAVARLADDGQAHAQPDGPHALRGPQAGRAGGAVSRRRPRLDWLALTTRAISIASTRMTSTPFADDRDQRLEERRAEAPAGRASSRATRASTSVESRSSRPASSSPLSPAEISPRSALNWISSGRTDCGLRPQQVALDRLEIGHVDRGQLGRGLVGPSRSACWPTSWNPRRRAWSRTLGSACGPAGIEPRGQRRQLGRRAVAVNASMCAGP